MLRNIGSLLDEDALRSHLLHYLYKKRLPVKRQSSNVKRSQCMVTLSAIF
jgi:hypothetical protein